MTPSDHGPMPRSRSSRASTAVGRQLAQALEIERAAEADERRGRGQSRARAAAARRGEPRHGLARRRRIAARARDGPLERARPPRLDQLAAHGAHDRLRHRRQPQRPQSLQLADRAAEQRVGAEAAHELRVVVVEREHEAEQPEPASSGARRSTTPSCRCHASPRAPPGSGALYESRARAQPEGVETARLDGVRDHRSDLTVGT